MKRLMTAVLIFTSVFSCFGQGMVGKFKLITNKDYRNWNLPDEIGAIKGRDTTKAVMFEENTFMLSNLPEKFDLYFKFPEGTVIFKDIDRQNVEGKCDLTLAADTLSYHDFFSTENRKMPQSKFLLAITNHQTTYLYIIDEYGDQTLWWNKFYSVKGGVQ